MHGQPLGKIAESRHGPAEYRYPGQGPLRTGRGNIQDIAPVPSNHILCKHLTGKECPQEIQIQHLLYAPIFQIEKCDHIPFNVAHLKIVLGCVGAGLVASCSVSQNITGAQFRQDPGMDAFQHILVHYIHLIGRGGAAHVPYLACNFLSRLQIDIQQGH